MGTTTKGSTSNKKPTAQEKNKKKNPKNPWECKVCGENFVTMSQLANHKNVKHRLVFKVKNNVNLSFFLIEM